LAHWHIPADRHDDPGADRLSACLSEDGPFFTPAGRRAEIILTIRKRRTIIIAGLECWFWWTG
jgi:hypothetical protein